MLTFCLCLAAIQNIPAQSVKEQKKDALKLLESGNDFEAMPILEELYRTNPTDADVNLGLAKAYLRTNHTGESLEVIDHALKTDKKRRAELLRLKAENHHLRHNFAEAIRIYKAALAEKMTDRNTSAAIKDQIMRCASGLKLSKQAGKGIVDNLGVQVNTIYDEFAPVLSPNYSTKLYFASANERSNGGKRNKLGLADRFGNYSSDIYAAYLSNGSWTNTAPISYMINGPRNEYIAGFTGQGKEMYFFRGFTLFSGEILVDTFQKNNDQLMNPRYFNGPLQTWNGDRDLSFVSDSVILFASNRTGGYGGFDLYMSRKQNDIWSTPVNLGPEINSPYDELTPFLSQDGTTLYFSSNNLNSMGGFDIFFSHYNPRTTKWQLPVNAGMPLNSAADDLYFFLSPEKYYGYFSSSRLESVGGRDIYSVFFSEIPEPVKQTIKQDISGMATNEFPSKPAQESMSDVRINNNVANAIPGETVRKFEVEPLFYKDDYNLLTDKNIAIMNKVTAMLNENPKVRLVLSCHSYNGDNPKIEAYLTLRRAEQIRDYLISKGADRQQILIRGVGKNFPVIKDVVPQNAEGIRKNLSSRVDFNFSNGDDAGISFVYQETNVTKNLVDERYKKYQNSNFGLVFRVQVAASSRMNSSAVLDEFTDFIIEERPKSDLLYYLVGNSQSFSEISLIRSEIQQRDVRDAFIVPYLNGWPLTRNQAVQLKSEYPELAAFLKEAK